MTTTVTYVGSDQASVFPNSTLSCVWSLLISLNLILKKIMNFFEVFQMHAVCIKLLSLLHTGP